MESPKFGNQQPSSPDSTLHFLDYWRIIRIRSAIIFTVWFLIVLIATVTTLIIPKEYSSMVRIAINKSASDIPEMGFNVGQQPGGFDPFFIQTEFQKITSKLVLYQVIEDLRLNELYQKKRGLSQPLTQRETYELLVNKIDVRPSRNTSLIEIEVLDRDADDAARIANKIAETYRKSRLDSEMQKALRGIEAMTEELASQDQQITEAEAVVANLRKEFNISDAVAQGIGGATIEPETVRRLEGSRTMAQADYAQLSTLLNELTSKSYGDLRKAISVAYPDNQLNSLESELSQTEQRLAALSPDLGAQNPELVRVLELKKKIEAQISHRIDQIVQGLQIRVRGLDEQVKYLAEEVERAKTKEVEAFSTYQPYFSAKRKLENLEKVRDVVRIRILQEKIDAYLPKLSIVEVFDPAEPDTKPARPKLFLNIALAVFAGLIIAFALAFFIEYLDTSVKTIDDVEKALQAPVIGVIPQNVGSLLKEGLDSPHAEAYRVLRTNVMFSSKTEEMRTLIVVSGGAGEGKSTTIFNLATVFAQNGARVLIVDSDLRRPSLHKILNVSNNLGLTNYLLKQNKLEEIVQTTDLPTLDFISSGKMPSSSMGILNSAAMKGFVAEMRQRYDYIFFDSPPILGVSDASILASVVDMAILVVQYRKYPQAMTLRAKQMVEKVGGSLLGIVLNNINISQDSYYYYYSGYYYDSYYSRKGMDDDEDEGAELNGKGKGSGEEGGSGGREKAGMKKKF